MEENKLCPCCGNKPELIVFGTSGKAYIYCSGGDIETQLSTNEKQAWTKWNGRVNDPA